MSVGLSVGKGFKLYSVCVNQGFIVIELKLSYEPLAHLRWRTQVSVDFPTPDGRRFDTGSSVVHGARI